MTGLAEARAALERGKNVVLVCAPAPEQAAPVWELTLSHRPGNSGPGLGAVIVCPDPAAATEWVPAAPAGRRVHAVTGLSRAARLLKDGGVDVLAGATPDLAALVSRSALKLGTVATFVIAWPEAAPAEHAAQLDALLGEAREAGRLVLTWNPALLGGLLDAHAHRAPVIGPLPVGADGRPLPPVGRARFAVVASGRRSGALRDALDVLDPARAFIWTLDPRHAQRITALLDAGAGRGGGGVVVDSTPPDQDDRFDAVICARVPTREQFAALSRVAPPIVLVAPYQLPYLRSLASPLEPLHLPSVDRARDRAEAARARIADALERGGLDAELNLLAPLFERFDPAEVAAALLALERAPGTPKAAPETPGQAGQPWVTVFINVGKKDRAGAKDLVGALIKEVGIARDQIGRIDVRETFTLVAISTDAVERVVRGLTGVSIKGRRAVARLERA